MTLRSRALGPWAWLLAAALSLSGCSWGNAPTPQTQAERDAVLASTLPMPSSDSYRTEYREWHDAARDRSVPVKLYLPVGQAPAKALVVFSHGLGGSREGYSYLGKYWAAQGYASLHLQHMGSDRSLWGGNPLELFQRLRDAAQESQAIARVKDLSFALDQVLADPAVKDRLAGRPVVAAGHSYGANTSMLAAGAQVPRDSGWLSLRDARIQAAILISAPPFYGETQLPAIVGPIAVPTLHVTATEDVIQIPGYHSGLDDRVAVFQAMGGADKTLVVFRDGSHSVFTDRLNTGGAINPALKDATRTLGLAFLERLYGGDAQAWPRWPQAHRALLAQTLTAQPETKPW